MINTFLDPYVLSTLSMGDTEASVSRFFDRLLSCRQLLQSRLATILLIEGGVDLLFRTESYPGWDLLSSVTERAGPIFQPRDVVVVVGEILNKSRMLNREVGIDAVLVDDYQCEPDAHLQGRPQPFIEHFADLTAIMSLSILALSWNSKWQFVLTAGLAGEHAVLTVRMKFADIETSQEAVEKYIGEVGQAALDAHSSARSIFSGIDPLGIMCSDPSLASVEAAVHLSIASDWGGHVGAAGSTGVHEWQIGSQFIGSASALGFFTDQAKAKKLLRALVKTIVDDDLGATHRIRVDKGGSSSQLVRQRDGAGAWRRDIDRDFHLHYWRSSARVELAKVVVHNDFSIPE